MTWKTRIMAALGCMAIAVVLAFQASPASAQPVERSLDRAAVSAPFQQQAGELSTNQARAAADGGIEGPMSYGRCHARGILGITLGWWSWYGCGREALTGLYFLFYI
ncbi:hypothetical protein ABTW72_23550 [Micromonospora sp. NPDC127501]|uniref:hypothetical protein n=1 Tax=Micromonospora sp. NPDC127501 TaxID=3154872 RepID=UPI00332999D7